MMDLVVQLLGMTAAILGHFFNSTVTLTNDVSGEWFATYDASLSAKGHAVTGAISSIIDYGTVFLAQLLAVIVAGSTSAVGSTTYLGAGNYQLITAP